MPVVEELSTLEHALFLLTIAYYISEWVIRLVMLALAARKQKPSVAVAWLLVIFVAPWIGLILYLLFAHHRLPAERIEQHRRFLEKSSPIWARFRGHPSIVHPEVGPEMDRAVTLAERLGEMPILGNNDLEFLTDTDRTIDRLIADIDLAERHVHLLFYIFADDETGRRVADALARAEARGVECRLLVDAVGSKRMLRNMPPRLRAKGIEIHAALPVGLFRGSMARVDLRNHRKVAVIDGLIGYTGSQNIVNASYGHKDLAWEDIMVRVTGPLVLELQAVFHSDWYFETGIFLEEEGLYPDPPIAGNIAVQTLPSGPSYPVENYQRVVVSALYAARERVIITTPYFIPDEPFLQALQVATTRGVQVDLIVPERSDQILVGAASHSYYDDVLDAGVRLHLFREGLLHSKTVSIDHTIGFLGTSNLDIRSFALNFEINLIFYTPETVAELQREQIHYIERSVPMTIEEWRTRPAWRKVAQNIGRLFSPLL